MSSAEWSSLFLTGLFAWHNNGGVMAPDLLTDYELMVLLAILAAGERARGAAIACEIRQRGGRRVVLREITAPRAEV